ncbi:MAG: tRNA1(Val) (adenine(37)-N6)-methyltransferase [Bacilli bacterium]|nr:tRNA1(Val) (adenine(37)-N6)-methyltransferase [Bacilli bacterium]MDD4733259.1 tRNA1(Val) (adenine(37)-N6)-methyltransferase [Bacilli bacterium]
MEKENYIFGNEDLVIYQNENLFKMSLDSVLLARFVRINKTTKKIIDIGTGNAPIPLVLSKRGNFDILAVEIQNEIFKLGKKSIEANNKDIKIINADIKEEYKNIKNESYDLVTCNPPYFKYTKESNINIKEEYALSRHEISLNLEDIMIISKKILKNKGSLAIVQRPENLVRIITLMRKYNIEPKRLMFVYPKKNKEANIMLIEGTKNGLPGIKVLDPLYVHDENGYTEEIMNFVRRGEM